VSEPDETRARRFWDARAADYDRSMWLLGRPLPRAIELSCEQLRGSGRVLEVAAGTGSFTRPLAREVGTLVATDYAPGMVERLRASVADLANVAVEQADVYALRCEPGSFDAVLAANVLHLLPDLPGALAALQRVLVPGGQLVAPTYVHAETLRSHVVSRLIGLTGFPGQRRLSSQTLVAALEQAGFVVERRETIPGAIPIAWVAARTLSSRA
jgi:SAM-dependent methyltransferase